MLIFEKCKIKPPESKLPFNITGCIVTNTDGQTALIVEEKKDTVILKSLKTFDITDKELEIVELLKQKYNGDDVAIYITPRINRELEMTLVGSPYEEF